MCDETLSDVSGRRSSRSRDDYSDSDRGCKKSKCDHKKCQGERGPRGEKGEKGCRGEKGEKGCQGERGSRGEKGCDGERGHRGEKGCEGERGPKGEKGERGCRGEQGPPCKHECIKACLEFCDTPDCDTHKVYRVDNKLNVVVYAFRESCEVPLRFCRQGIEIDSCAKEYIQIDLSDYTRIKNLHCTDPTIKISGIQKYEKFVIYGSNELGCRGKELYCYTNQHESSVCKELTIPSFDTVNLTRSGDLYLYGPNAFKYISVAAFNGTVFINNLNFYLYE